jgi:hypothetical protein
LKELAGYAPVIQNARVVMAGAAPARSIVISISYSPGASDGKFGRLRG